MKKKKLTPDEEYERYRYRCTKSAWKNMLIRCYNEKCKRYKDWGGRGIRVDITWFNWETFLHDMGLKPTGAHSLDRIDNNGNYESGNCRWATTIEQAQNKRPIKPRKKPKYKVRKSHKTHKLTWDELFHKLEITARLQTKIASHIETNQPPSV